MSSLQTLLSTYTSGSLLNITFPSGMTMASDAQWNPSFNSQGTQIYISNNSSKQVGGVNCPYNIYDIPSNTLTPIQAPSGFYMSHNSAITSFCAYYNVAGSNNVMYYNDSNACYIVYNDSSASTFKQILPVVASNSPYQIAIDTTQTPAKMYVLYGNNFNSPTANCFTGNFIYSYSISQDASATLSGTPTIIPLSGFTNLQYYGNCLTVNNNFVYLSRSDGVFRYTISGTTLTSSTLFLQNYNVSNYVNSFGTTVFGSISNGSLRQPYFQGNHVYCLSNHTVVYKSTDVSSQTLVTPCFEFDISNGMVASVGTNPMNVSITATCTDSNGTVFVQYASKNIWAIFYAIPIICFKEDTQILTINGYKSIQDLRKGDLIKTSKNGYKPIYKIGTNKIIQQSTSKRIKDQLYKCSTDSYPELFEDLVITGSHCILVDSFKNEKEKQNAINVNMNKLCVTEDKYRLPACVDERTTIYEELGTHNIYHFALENDEYCENYGVYANGLLVESTSKRFIDTTLHEIL